MTIHFHFLYSKRLLYPGIIVLINFTGKKRTESANQLCGEDVLSLKKVYPCDSIKLFFNPYLFLFNIIFIYYFSLN